jgi:hypothetical protein
MRVCGGVSPEHFAMNEDPKKTVNDNKSKQHRCDRMGRVPERVEKEMAHSSG